MKIQIQLITALVLLFTINSFSQSCGDMFYDDGGLNGNYTNSLDETTTICPDDAGDIVTVIFDVFETESNYDWLKIYDGDTTSATLIGEYTGTNSPGIISAGIANGGCLTFQFHSDSSFNREGWEARFFCSPPITCFPLAELNVDDITATTVDLSWVDGNSPSASYWEIEYGLSGFQQGNGAFLSSNINTITLSSLASGANYDVYVRSICGVDDNSFWFRVNFKTKYAAPYTENFDYDGDTPEGWSIQVLNDLSLTSVENSIYNTTTDSNDYFVFMEDVNYSQSSLSPFVDVSSLSNPILSFYYVKRSNSVSSNRFYVEVWDGFSWNEMYSNTNVNTFGWLKVNIDLSTLNITGNIKAKFRLENLNGTSTYDDVLIDDVSFIEAPVCIDTPTNIVITNITDHEANVSWDMPNIIPLNGYEIVINGEGFNEANNVFNTNTNSFTFTDLSAYRDYHFQIKALCSSTDSSSAAIGTFKTLHTIIVCGGKFFDPGENGDYSRNENETYTICPENAGELVTVQFIDFETEVNDDTLTIYNGNSTSAPVLGVYSGINIPPTYTSSDTSGCLTFVFVSDNDFYRRGFGWEANVFCTQEPSCSTPTNISITQNAINNEVLVNWDDDTSVTQWEVEIVNSGQQPTGVGTVVSENSIVLSGLSLFNEYKVFVRAVCNISFWTPNEFRLMPAPVDYPYTVEPIPYKLYNHQLVAHFQVDDRYSALIDLGYTFNYFGYNYSKVLLGTNSVLSFNIDEADRDCAWNFDEPIPSENVIDNAILGAYQDFFGLDNTFSGVVNIGTAPFRKFITVFDNVTLFGCQDITSTNQTILYETYNFIDVQVKDRNVCVPVNNQNVHGNGVIGIQSVGGAYAYVAPNRNTGDWEAHDEGWRFRPVQNHPDYQYIICDANIDGVEIFDLNTIYTHFGDGTSNTYTTFVTLADAENNSNSISTTTYTNITNAQTIFVRELTTAGDISIKQVLLAAIDCTADYDLDTIDTVDEDLNNNGNYGDDDTDGDQIPDFIDEDDDGDYVLTSVEAVETTPRNTTNTTSYLDTDGDQTPNYLDNEDDGDGILSLDEDINGNYNLLDDDTDGDNIPDYLDNEALSVSNYQIGFFNMYPNPAKDKLIIELNKEQSNVTIKIYTIQGQQVYSKQNINNILEINVSSLSNGVYFVNVMDDNQTYAKKFIKE